MPRASSSSSAGCMRSRSDSEPTTIPTRALDMGDGGDVPPVSHAGERDLLARRVRSITGVGDRVSRRRDVENAAAVCDEAVSVERGPGVKDERAGLASRVEPGDRGADVPRRRILAGCDDDGHCGDISDLDLVAPDVADRASPEGTEEVSFQPRQDHLGFGISEATIELQYARTFLSEHEAGVKDAYVRRPTSRKLCDDGPVNRLEDVLEERVTDVMNRREGPHPSSVRTHVAVADTTVVARRGKRHDVLAVDEGEHRQLVSLEQLLDHQRVPECRCRAERGVELVLI